MLYKVALCDVKPLKIDASSKSGQMVRTASGKVLVEPGTDKATIIEAAVKRHPTALFFRAKAIKADEENSNGDYFSKDELLKAYKSFEGAPFFTNHDNQNIENARGKIIFAEWVEEENAVYTIAFVDREAFPHICRSIEEEYVTGVSMGCSVEYSICNICDNKAEKTDDYCTHIRNRKGRKFSGKARNVNTGEIKEFKDEPVFEYNYGLNFIELSAVVDPACNSCHIEGIIPNEDYLRRVANLQNTLYMVKTAALEKKAGQEEITQLNEVLGTLEDIAVSLIQNRQQVEVEFASDLVEILSNLQTFVDELVGAGYGNVQGGIPGTVEPEMAPPAEGEVTPPPAGAEGLPEAVTPVAEETAEGPVGTVTGSPTRPLVQTPQLPISAPAKPLSFDTTKLTRLSDLNKAASSVRDKIRNTGEIVMGKRRTVSEKLKQRESAIEVLSNSWQEKQNFFEYIKQVPSIQDNENKLSVKKTDDSFIIVAENKNAHTEKASKVWTYEDLTKEERREIKESPREAALKLLDTFANSLNKQKEGVTIMRDIKQEAGANSVNKEPEVITERQLADQRDLYHAREDAERDSITEKQLADDTGSHKHAGEQEVLTEAQLEGKTNRLHPREDEEREVITERQLNDDRSGVSPRKEDESNVITQKQLADGGNQTDYEPEVITERQLDDVAAPWERAANRDASLFKSSSDHMDAVLDKLADTVIATGCSADEACDSASTLVDSTQNRVELLEKILDEGEEDVHVDYKKRLAFWSNRNIKLSSVGQDDISQLLVSGLKKLASDTTINPEVVIDALEVLTESSEGSEAISNKVDEKLAAAQEEPIRVSKKEELRNALKSSAKKEEEGSKESSKESRDEERKEILASVEKEEKSTRGSERQAWKKSLASKDGREPDTVIKTSFDELGRKKEGYKKDPSFKASLRTFAQGALASQNIRLASVTNVTINGDTIQIAVQTEEGEMGESVEIPIGETTAPAEAEVVPEGEMAGEALEAAMPAVASSKTMKRKAQAPMGGGVPGTPGEVAGGPGAPEMGLPTPPPEGGAVDSLTVEEEEVVDEIPTAGEQQPLGTICPECGSSDVDVTTDENSNLMGKCNNPECGAEYEALVKKNIEYRITKPSKLMSGEEGAEAPEAPEVPALPVAAQTKLGKDSLIRIAKNQEAHGHVCPACGMTQCKVASESNGHTEFSCPACGTEVEKDLMVNINDPEGGFLRVKWDLVPDMENCEGCEKDKERFASLLKVEGMMKKASNGKTEFPMTNCIERLARQYGGNATATFGPCKGKPLAECVCGKLERLGGLRSVRHLEKLASVSMQKDPMDECLEDQKAKGFELVEAEKICGCIKKKFATESDDNIFVQAFAEDVESGREKILTAQDLVTIRELLDKPSEEVVVEDFEDVDIGDELPPEEVAEEEVVTLEVSRETAEDLAAATETAVEEVPSEVEVEVVEEELTPEPEMDSATEIEVATDSEAEVEENEIQEELSPEEEKEMALSMQTHKLRRVGEEVVKIAATPKKVEEIEDCVDAGVPRAKATMGEEDAENIDVSMAKPSVPRANAEMGHEGADNINPKAGLPDVAVDSAYMGVEKEVQKDMPAISDKIKGTVIAEGEKKTREAKQLKEVDTVEKDVDAGVPRAKATMGEESAENIDVSMAKPSVPRANAEMGHEGADNINPKATGPDVAVDNAFMGHEKEVQSDMPAINNEMLKQVQMKKDLQVERIAAARRMKAVEVTAKLLAARRIKEESYDDIVEALSKFEIDKITKAAENMFPKVPASPEVKKEASGHQVPAIVLESKEQTEGDNLATKLASAFTVGNRSFDENLTRYGEK